MEQNPPVTWLMAVRNGMPFLPQTLASIEAQTYPHYQIIVWDNGSTDGTLEELAKWIPSRLTGTVIANRPLGFGASRAALINAAQTELCVWNDADDLSHPERVAKQAACLQQNPDAVLVGSQIENIDENGRPSSLEWVAPTDDAEVRWATRWTPKNLTGACMFRRSKVIEAGNYRDNKPIEDHDLLMRLSLLGRMPNHPEALFQYRRHAASITSGVADRFVQFRACAQLNAGILFPGLSPEQAMRVWDAVARFDSSEPVRISDSFLLQKAAKALATAVGADPSYFRQTAFFAEQNYHLKRRIMQSLGLSGVWRLRQKLGQTPRR